MIFKRLTAVLIWSVLFAVLWSGLAATITMSYLLTTNTLENNGQWESTKQRLEMFLMGSYSYMRRPQALAGSCLHLGAWHGFQEVLVRTKVRVRQVDFDFSLPGAAYVSFIINKDHGACSGIRISANPDFDSMYFTARDDGEFLTKTKLRINNISPDTWRHFRLVAGNPPALDIDSARIDVPGLVVPAVCKIGFRGCMKDALVRNLRVEQQTYTAPFVETFFLTEHWPAVFGLAMAGVLLASLFLVLSSRMAAVEWRRCLFILLEFNFLAVLVGAAIVCYIRVGYINRYPLSMSLARAEAAYLENTVNIRRDEIKAAYPETRPPNVERILFIGSSQTYGSGTTKPEDAFVNRLEDRFNHMGTGRKYECINAGIVGQSADILVNCYEEDWLKLTPQVVVINLSNNDFFEDRFEKSLERFAALSREHNIKTVFVLEANSIELRPAELVMHPVMRKVAERNHIPVIDLHGYLKKNYDRGFLWWDFVHLTSFGHQLAADCLFEGLRDIVATAK